MARIVNVHDAKTHFSRLLDDAHAGGQAPYAVYRMALASGLFEDLGQVNSLGLLRRL